MPHEVPDSASLSLSDPRLRGAHEIASSVAMTLAFPLAAGALWIVESALIAMLFISAGFVLVVSRLKRARAQVEDRLGLAEALVAARSLLARGAHGQARWLARRVADQARVPQTQRSAVETLAWCELELGSPEAARNALSCIEPKEELDPYCWAAVEDACGNSGWALRILETAARRKRKASRPATRLRIDLCARVRGMQAACELALHELATLDPEDVQRIIEAASREGSSAALRALLAARAGLRDSLETTADGRPQ